MTLHKSQPIQANTPTKGASDVYQLSFTFPDPPQLEDVRVDEREDGKLCLTDGQNFLWVFFNDDGRVRSFTRWAPNGDPRYILSEIEEKLDVVIVSEYEPQYWGFDTWEAVWEDDKR